MNAPNALTRDRVPDHVRPESVVDFDLYRDHRFEEEGGLHEGLWRLIQESGQGIFWTPHNGGHWFITDHELLFEAAKRPDLFSSTAMTLPPMPADEEPRLIPLGLDPPVHGHYRLPLMRAFSPDIIKAMESGIRSFAAELIEGIKPDGRAEFVEAIAEPMPILIFMKLMGMPLDRLREFREWVYDMLSSDNERRASSYGHVHAMMEPLIREREAAPRDDLISRLVHSEIDGRPTTYDEVQAYCLLLFAAGLDTVANSLSFGVNLLSSDQELQARLRANPELIPEAVEEFLRRYGIVFTPRTAALDVSFGGVDIRGGERVLLMLPAGNLDPTAFPEPALFDLDRENKAHMTFNSGPHRCIGSHLARLELRVFYEEWLKRMPTVRIDPAKKVTYRTGLTLALDKVPIVWDVAD